MASGSPAEVLLETFGVDSVTGKQNLDLLASLAPNLLAVMFNVFSKAGKEGRGYVLDCISAYLSILTKKVGRRFQGIFDLQRPLLTFSYCPLPNRISSARTPRFRRSS